MIFKSSYGDIYYNLKGKKEGKTIVFTHGVAMDHRSFKAQANHFSDDFQVLVWDMPGHGESFPCDKEFNYEMVANVLNELLDHLNIEKIIHAGVSLGGHIGQYFAFHYPERVEKLVDIGSSPLHKPFNKFVSWVINIGLYFSYLIPEILFNKMFAKDKAVKKSTQDYLFQTATLITKRKTMKITFAFMDALKEGIKKPVEQPLLIIMGEKDLQPLRKGAEKWSKDLGLQYEIISDAGHIAHQDNPEIFNGLMESFIKNNSNSQINNLKPKTMKKLLHQLTAKLILTVFLTVGLQATLFSLGLSSVTVNFCENPVIVKEDCTENKTDKISKSADENVEEEFDINKIIYVEPEVKDIESGLEIFLDSMYNGKI